MRTVKIYCDGACSGNPGPGGYGVVLVDVVTGKERKLSGYVESTTNNQMEIYACIAGLEKLTQRCIVEIITDSKYVVNTMTLGWKRNKNIELWNMLDNLVSEHIVTFTWVKGHASNEYNNQCDKLAVQAYKEKHGYDSSDDELEEPKEWNDETMLGVSFDLVDTFDWKGHLVKIYNKEMVDPFTEKDKLVFYIATVDDMYLVPNIHMLGYTDRVAVQNNALALCDKLNKEGVWKK